ncbi:unnamed protein product [[Candida] boidinii]|nr:unnamed protein product [[Candida] boidinii]
MISLQTNSINGNKNNGNENNNENSNQLYDELTVLRERVKKLQETLYKNENSSNSSNNNNNNNNNSAVNKNILSNDDNNIDNSPSPFTKRSPSISNNTNNSNNNTNNNNNNTTSNTNSSNPAEVITNSATLQKNFPQSKYIVRSPYSANNTNRNEIFSPSLDLANSRPCATIQEARFGISHQAHFFDPNDTTNINNSSNTNNSNNTISTTNTNDTGDAPILATISGSDPDNNNSTTNTNTSNSNTNNINNINNNSVRLPSITLDSNANTPTGFTPIDFASRSQPGTSVTVNGAGMKLALPPLDKNSPGFPLSPPVFSASTTPAAQTGIPASSQMAIGGSHHQEQQKQQQEPQKQQEEQHREEGNGTLQTYPVDQRKQVNNQNNYTPSDTGDSFFDLLNVNNSRPGNVSNTPGNNFAGLLSFNNNTGPQGILNSSLQNYTNNPHTPNGNINNNGRVIASNGNNTLNPMLNGTSIPYNVFNSTNNNTNSNALNSFAQQ